MKAFLSRALIIPFLFGTSALADTYSHEFVNPDGTSTVCSTSVYGKGGSTSCKKRSIDQRMNVYKAQKQYADKSRSCIDKAMKALETDSPSVSSIIYSSCMGIGR